MFAQENVSTLGFWESVTMQLDAIDMMLKWGGAVVGYAFAMFGQTICGYVGGEWGTFVLLFCPRVRVGGGSTHATRVHVPPNKMRSAGSPALPPPPPACPAPPLTSWGSSLFTWVPRLQRTPPRMPGAGPQPQGGRR
jgi:hypothetical protein